MVLTQVSKEYQSNFLGNDSLRDIAVYATKADVQVDRFSSVQLSHLTDWVEGDTCGTIQQKSSFSLFFFFFMREATMSSSGTGRDVHSLTLSIQHFLC